jgi:hypothetical protein
MGVMVDLIDAIGVKKAGAAHDAVHLVSFIQQEAGEIRSVLAGYASD